MLSSNTIIAVLCSLLTACSASTDFEDYSFTDSMDDGGVQYSKPPKPRTDSGPERDGGTVIEAGMVETSLDGAWSVIRSSDPFSCGFRLQPEKIQETWVIEGSIASANSWWPVNTYSIHLSGRSLTMDGEAELYSTTFELVWDGADSFQGMEYSAYKDVGQDCHATREVRGVRNAAD